MNVYVVRGRHGELYVTHDGELAFNLWAETNGFSTYQDFLTDPDLEDSFEFSEDHWFLDEGGEVNRVEVQ